MNNHLQEKILKALNAKEMVVTEVIQSLWSGYGRIFKAEIQGISSRKVVIKHIQAPSKQNHPRGWNTNVSHQRKLRSYEVEKNWYQKYAALCTDECRVPKLYTSVDETNELLLVLEDLDESGFSGRKSSLNFEEVKVCLNWLANFHARFMNKTCPDLWEKGSYWHLDTRPDEWEAMAEGKLKQKAKEIDQILDGCFYKTIVHGDAKVANFCFDNTGIQVAAVDFQYVGSGCGMKDVVYLMGSCLASDECEAFETILLDHYFDTLKRALEISDFNGRFEDVENEWRPLYAYAWTDFTRFLQGWLPSHQKLNGYSKKLMYQVLREL